MVTVCSKKEGKEKEGKEEGFLLFMCCYFCIGRVFWYGSICVFVGAGLSVGLCGSHVGQVCSGVDYIYCV